MTISISSEVAESIQIKYPRKVSQLVEEYFRSLLSATEDEDKFNLKEDIIKKISDVNVELNSKKANLKALKLQLEEQEQKEKEQKELKLSEAREKYFELPKSESEKLNSELKRKQKEGIISTNITPVEYYMKYYDEEI